MTDKIKSIYELGLHESIAITTNLGGKVEVTRVSGGWIYCYEYPGFRQAPIVFVPFDNEFMSSTKLDKKIK